MIIVYPNAYFFPIVEEIREMKDIKCKEKEWEKKKHLLLDLREKDPFAEIDEEYIQEVTQP